jgi:hypothetical protein
MSEKFSSSSTAAAATFSFVGSGCMVSQSMVEPITAPVFGFFFVLTRLDAAEHLKALEVFGG